MTLILDVVTPASNDQPKHRPECRLGFTAAVSGDRGGIGMRTTRL
ncbi:hypothetical protein I546_3097 [Mycobacterium kansasii 732]|nr:hypothetical protein I546_3097 [Mycobacterium kansasii 732]